MNTLDTTALLNQVASATAQPRVETPLHHAELGAMARQTELASKNAGVYLCERSLTGQLALRVRGNIENASKALENIVGFGLPTRLTFFGQPTAYDKHTLAWVSPDEWRLCCPIAQVHDLETQIRVAFSKLADVTHAVVNTTGGYTVLELYGANAQHVLKKSTGYDIRAERFPVGKAVGTTFAKSTATLLRVDDDRWQLWVRRSFADYLWLWLQHSAAEYGLRITED